MAVSQIFIEVGAGVVIGAMLYLAFTNTGKSSIDPEFDHEQRVQAGTDAYYKSRTDRIKAAKKNAPQP